MDVVRLVPGQEALLQKVLTTFRGLDERLDPGFLDDPANLALVALDGDEVIGWCWAHEARRPNGLATFVLYETEVREERRREGIGRLLLDAAAAHARDRGLMRMWLFQHAGSEPARRLYPGAGGEPGPRAGYWWVFE
jgi:GNAT superfamily N-acetyltransferase